MGIVGASLLSPSVATGYAGYSPSRSGYARWSPSNHAVTYEWCYANDWAVPYELGIYKAPEIGEAYADENLSPDIINNLGGEFFSTTSNNPNSIRNVISYAEINQFKNSTNLSKTFRKVESYNELIGERHDDGWVGYAGFYMQYATYIHRFYRVGRTTHNFQLVKLDCSAKNSLPEGMIALDVDCGQPLPVDSNSLENGGSPRFNRAKRRRDKVSGCCSCAAIADMNAQMLEQIKLMFDAQNNEIGSTLTEQTQFIQDQIVAAIPKGFDYQPIFNKIEDGTNKIWNGLNK